MRAGKPVLRGLRKAVPRLLVVDAFEDKIVAEHEPIARRPRRARESTVNGGHGDIHCDFRRRGDLHFNFHALSSWTTDLGGPHDIVPTLESSCHNPLLFVADP